MMASHTPGPWAWRWKSGSLHRVGADPYIYGDTVLHPSYEYDSGIETQVSESDAALIAAAPDLLRALEELVDEWGEVEELGNPFWNAARAAIFKARGSVV